MTSKEIAAYTYQHGKDCFKFDSGWSKEGLEKAIKRYAKQKCKEQRKICCSKFAQDKNMNLETILEAPEPEFD